jgi:voltage-gated potassium channel
VTFLDLMLKEQSKTLRVEEIALGADSPWVGKTIRQTEIHERHDLLALAVRQSGGQIKYNPHGDTVLAKGDVLIVMGEVHRVQEARRAAGEARFPPAA